MKKINDWQNSALVIRNSALVKCLALILAFLLIIPQNTFARKGRTGGMSSFKAFTSGAISAGVTAIGVGRGGIPAVIGTITSAYTGVYCYSQGYSREKTALISGAVGGFAGGLTGSIGGVARGLNTAGAFANVGISTVAGTAASYTSYKLQEAGVHPALASAGGTLAGLGVGFSLSKGASALGVWDNTSANAGNIELDNNGEVVPVTKGTTIRNGGKEFEVTGVKLTKGEGPKITYAVNGESHTVVGLPKFAQSIGAKVWQPTIKGPLGIRWSNDRFSQPSTWNTFNWSSVAHQSLGEAFLRVVPRVVVSSAVEAGVSEALGYDNDARKKGDILTNQIANAIGSFAGSLAGGFVQAGVNYALDNRPHQISPNQLKPRDSFKAASGETITITGIQGSGKDLRIDYVATLDGKFSRRVNNVSLDDLASSRIGLKDVNAKIEVLPHIPFSHYFNLKENLVYGGITSSAKIGFAYLNRGIDIPGLAGLTDIAAEALGSTVTDYLFRQDPGKAQRVAWIKYKLTPDGKVGSPTGKKIWNSDLAQKLPVKGGRRGFEKFIQQGKDYYGVLGGYAYKPVEETVNPQEEGFNIARKKAGFFELLGANFGANLSSAASEALPTVGPSSRIGQYAFQHDGYTSAFDYVQNIMGVSNFAQAVGRGTSPSLVIAGNFDSSGYYISSSSLGSSVSNAVLNPFRQPSERMYVGKYVGKVDGEVANYQVSRIRSGTLVDKLQGLVDKPQDSKLQDSEVMWDTIDKYLRSRKDLLPKYLENLEKVKEACEKAQNDREGKYIIFGQGLRETYRLYDFSFQPIAVKEYGTSGILTASLKAVNPKEILIANTKEKIEMVKSWRNEIPEYKEFRTYITWLPGEGPDKKERVIKMAKLFSLLPNFILLKNTKLSETALSPRGRSIFTQYYGPKLGTDNKGQIWQTGKIEKYTTYSYGRTPEGLERQIAYTLDKASYGDKHPIIVTDTTYSNPLTGTPLWREITEEYKGGPHLRAESEYHQALRELGVSVIPFEDRVKDLGISLFSLDYRRILANIEGAYFQSALSPLLNLGKVVVKTEGPVNYIDKRGFFFLPQRKDISGYYGGEPILNRENVYFYSQKAKEVFSKWSKKTRPISIIVKEKGKPKVLSGSLPLLPKTIRPVSIGGRVFFQDTGINTLYNLRPIYKITVNDIKVPGIREIMLPEGVGLDDSIGIPLQPQEKR